MKFLSLTTKVLLLLSLNACKKEAATNKVQGTNFNHLLKTVNTLTTLSGTVTTEYSYDGNNELSLIKTTDNITPTAPGLQTQQFYRNTAGKLDSIIFTAKSNGAITTATKTYFTYGAGGKLVLSIYDAKHDTGAFTKDSSLYLYAGSVLQSRTDYRSFDHGLTYVLLRQATYDFDAAGNVSKTIFQWPTNPSVDTLRFQYDSRVNPVPVWGGFFYWAPIFYDDFTSRHNLIQASGMDGGSSSSYFEYQYAPNNKPLYRKLTQPAGLDNSETYYYYD